MKKARIILIIFMLVLSATSATGENFTLSDDGLMALDWIVGNRTAILLEKTNVPGPGVRFVIEYQGNEPQDQGFRYVSHEDNGAGLLTGIDVSMYDYYQLKFTLLSIYSDTPPDPGAVLGVGALIGPYDDHTSAYDPEGLDFNPDPQYGTTAISSTPVRLDNTPSLLGFVAYLPWLDQWSPLGTTVAILVEAAPGAVAIPDLPNIYYVDTDIPVGGDGSSWMKAFNRLQDALAVAEAGDEIRVAQGLYKPIASIIPPPPPSLADSNEQETAATSGNRTATFQMKNGVVIKGGYAGFGEPDPNARDIKVYETVLSGDLMGNDVDVQDPCDLPNEPTRAENSYHVVTGSDCNESAVLDGFTITAGNANGEYYPLNQASGGGMFNNSSSPTLVNCTFTGNSAVRDGGAMYNSEQSNPTLTDCTFTGNSAIYDGGAMCNRESSPTVTNCTFSANSANHGGGISNWPGSPIVTACTFSGNSAELGAAVFNWDSSPTLTNCIFSGNSAREWGGAICNLNASSPTLANCTFNGNSAMAGGGVYNQESTSTLTNCILWGNTATTEPQIYEDETSLTIITYSDVQGGWPGTGNIDCDPCFVQPECLIPISYWKFDEGNETTAYDSVGQNHGTVYGAQWMSGQVTSALVFDGRDDYVDIPYDSSLDINASEGMTLSVWIKLNSYPDSYNQGPIFGLYDSTGAGTKNYLAIGKSTYGNVIAWDQWPPSGGSLNSITPDLDTWYHVVVVEDSSHRAIYINGSLDVSDNLFETYEGNPPDTIRIGSRADDWAPFYFDGSIDEAAVYNTVLTADEIRHHYYISLSGEGYPLMPDYHLLPGSPCIDTGSNSVVPPDMNDLDGNPRVKDGDNDGIPVVDMGAYEFFNTRPVANAGPDQIVECACNTEEGTKVILDGTGSYDVDGDLLMYTWIGPFVESPVQGAAPTVTLEEGCPGEYVVTLIVNDGIEDSEPDEVVITVVDTTPPDFNLSVTPTILWPPNHEMVEITTSWTVSDECDPAPNVSLVGIVANEGDDIIGDGHTSDDIQIDDDGTIYVRAERSGPGIGRIYTITYQAVDDFGNVTVCSATVGIPHELKFLARMGYRWLWRNHTGHLTEDLNGDGIVNLEDFAIFAAYWIQ